MRCRVSCPSSDPSGGWNPEESVLFATRVCLTRKVCFLSNDVIP
uniref:Uncharacterized protein n=1 Tax=Rhizophora mucronata TaxID=61149 RepID=A0A2P2PNF3_RHIMU